jgi:hypothetical protein
VTRFGGGVLLFNGADKESVRLDPDPLRARHGDIEVNESIKAAQEFECAVPIPAKPTAQACRDKEPSQARPPEEPIISTSTPASIPASPRFMTGGFNQFPDVPQPVFIRPAPSNFIVVLTPYEKLKRHVRANFLLAILQGFAQRLRTALG